MLKEILWNNLAPHVPRVELRRFKNIDFFPEHAPDFHKIESICIGSKTRTIGDPLQLSTLPSQLKKRYPHLKIYTYPRGFNPVVFTANPYISGVQWLPNVVYGDDCNLGTGHLIERKERFFGIEHNDPIRPELYLTPKEKVWAGSLTQSSLPKLPICVIHPWGKTRESVLTQAFWEELVKKFQKGTRFWQVGIEGQIPIAGCEKHFLLPRAYFHARKLFAVMSLADRFLGVDSGPMHVARAFEKPSLILTDFGVPTENIFLERRQTEGRANPAWNRYFLYEENRHFDVVGKTGEDVLRAAESFL